jgi:hypothetical protein
MMAAGVTSAALGGRRFRAGRSASYRDGFKQLAAWAHAAACTRLTSTKRPVARTGQPRASHPA